MELKKAARQAWKFIWEDDSVLSWAVNIVLAFVLIKFVVYPVLGLLLGTTNPIVAVISNSMEHPSGFDQWWAGQKDIYAYHNITEADFQTFALSNGFNKGDIIFLVGSKPENLKVGDVIVFRSQRPDPIIHRIVQKWQEDGKYYFKTKGDHNYGSIQEAGLDETRIPQDAVVGKAVFRLPYLGYIKIWFVDIINSVISIVRR